MKATQTRRFKKAFTMIEVMFMLMMFTMLIMVFGATLPTVAKMSTQSNIYTVVASIAQSKVTQLQESGYTKMNGVDLGEGGAKVIDADPSNPLPTNANGKGTATFNFTQRDNLWKYLPGGMDANKNPVLTGASAPYGTIKLEPVLDTYYIEDDTVTTGGTVATVSGMIKATVTISWKSANLPRVNYTVVTYIPRATYQ
jgi:competence protein ComGC